MLDVAAGIAGGAWPDADWTALAEAACRAALAETPHAGLIDARFCCEISIRLTDDNEVQTLNAQYRGKDKPTNVLSFPMLERDDLLALSADGPPEMLGDIALAWETCTREASEKAISVEHHATHLIIHALLHLAGLDHEISPADARAMEKLEIKTLAYLGIADPYGDHNFPEE